MNLDPNLDRRTLLGASAAAAGAVILSACSPDGDDGPANDENGDRDGSQRQGSEVEPLAPPAEFKEAPELAERVEAGELPPVEERLPTSPYVVPHKWLEDEGNYGGNLLMISNDPEMGPISNHMYGHSLLRYLNDGLDIGPGLVESWESNDDASEWTLHLREGVKWSDGEPLSSADFMFWWEDIILNEEHSEVPPDEARSGRGTLMELSAPDDHTLVMMFDSPAPLTVDRLAMWPNGRAGGPWWVLPRHYLEQFHPRYNDSAPNDWAAAGGAMENMSNFGRNPECPTLTGWRARDYNEGNNTVWERNPYYWCVGPDGAQLPYLDTITVSAVQDIEVGKLQVQEGEVDYLHGPHFSTTLGDVSGLMQSRERANIDVRLWDSGSGTGAVLFVNYDHPDEQLRELFREPTFRQALSHAINREEIRRSVYFDRGEMTTGTLSPKAIEYQVNEEGRRVYEEWRDSYVAYDVEKANALLDELGLEDSFGDGWRELPDGSELTLRLDFPADARPEYMNTNNQTERDWKEVGLNTTQNPVSPTAFGDQWEAGKLMIRTAWEVGDGPNHLVFPAWLVPIEPARYAPLTGQFYNVRGTPEENQERNVDPFDRTPPRMEPEPGGPIEQLWELYDQSKVEPDEMARHRLVWEMIRIHIEHGPFFIGTVANAPQVIVVRNGLRNVPRQENLALGGFVNPSIHPTPAIYDPECYFWDDPDQHT